MCVDAGLLVCTVFLNHDESSHDVLCVLTLGFWSVLCSEMKAESRVSVRVQTEL